MIEAAYGELAKGYAPIDAKLDSGVTLLPLELSFDSSAERATHRLTGIALALVVSLALWGAIGYGIWAAVHAFA